MQRLSLLALAALLCSCSTSKDDAGCPAATKACGDACVSVETTETGCASNSCEPCPVPANGSAICVQGACAAGPCAEGFENCNGVPTDGCEAALSTDVNHCGSCDVECDGTHGDVACVAGKCSASCSTEWKDCNSNGEDGCETNTNISNGNCGLCGAACASDELCADGVCSSKAAALAWLAGQKGGWCLDDYAKLVNLCGKVSVCEWTLCGDLDQEDPATSQNCYEDYLHEHERAVPFCCDPTYFRAYPDGIAMDIGFHYDGVSTGTLVDLGGDVASNRILVALTAPGEAKLSFIPAERVSFAITVGTHLLSVRITSSTIATFLDGVLVGQGLGINAPIELEATSGPGFTLGARMSYWWDAGEKALRFAPFFVHLRDKVVDPTIWSLDEATLAGEDTVVLFDPTGVSGNQWDATEGEPTGFAIPKNADGTEPVWADDVAADCP